jgi:hypothetical protein
MGDTSGARTASPCGVLSLTPGLCGIRFVHVVYYMSSRFMFRGVRSAAISVTESKVL